MGLGLQAATVAELSAEYNGTSAHEVTNIMSPFKSEVQGFSNTLNRRIQIHQASEEQKSADVIE